jgi:hypothetical protein
MYTTVFGIAATLLISGVMLQPVFAQSVELEPPHLDFPLDAHYRKQNAMYVTLQVQTDVALALHQRRPHTAASKELLQTAKELDVVLKPLHPGVEDRHLVSYFTVEVPDSATAEVVLAHLRNCKAVEAAYIKPPDEMP